MQSWDDNSKQFPRLIAEAEAAGAFTPEVLDAMAESMDLTPEDICEIIDRAQETWELIVAVYT